MSQSVSRSAAADLSLDDLDLQGFQGSGSPWIKRSLMAAGALAFLFVIYLGASGSEGEETAQLQGVATKTVTARPVPEVEAEPSAWEKEQAMLKEADRLDDAAKAHADAFGASLAGESKTKEATTAPAKRKAVPKAKKKAAASVSAYDPMNGSL